MARTPGPTLQETIPMKAIVVTDQAAGTAGMKLAERPEPAAAINDVVVQVHASGFTWDELTWPARVSRRRARPLCHRRDPGADSRPDRGLVHDRRGGRVQYHAA